MVRNGSLKISYIDEHKIHASKLNAIFITSCFKSSNLESLLQMRQEKIK